MHKCILLPIWPYSPCHYVKDSILQLCDGQARTLQNGSGF
ncbi:hypothetical protein LLB_2235 [Legionella longbeachae D-4968]|nr:hypothetical protein LLB_2235 [Legionella longbeachae D-4968]